MDFQKIHSLIELVHDIGVASQNISGAARASLDCAAELVCVEILVEAGKLKESK